MLPSQLRPLNLNNLQVFASCQHAAGHSEIVSRGFGYFSVYVKQPPLPNKATLRGKSISRVNARVRLHVSWLRLHVVLRAARPLPLTTLSRLLSSIIAQFELRIYLLFMTNAAVARIQSRIWHLPPCSSSLYNKHTCIRFNVVSNNQGQRTKYAFSQKVMLPCWLKSSAQRSSGKSPCSLLFENIVIAAQLSVYVTFQRNLQMFKAF